MEKLSIATRSGLKLAAIYTAPQTNEGKCPIVILLHGNTGWKEEGHLATLAEDLAANGIASLRFDAPGSGESDGTWEKDYRVSNYLNVISEVLDYANKNLPVDSAKIGIWGHSMGGMVAVFAAAQNPKVFQAVCGCQLSSGPMAGNNKSWQSGNGKSIETEIFGTIHLPTEYFTDRAQYKTEEAIKKLKIPLQLIAGTTDDLVSVEQVKRLFRTANEPKQYHEFPMTHFYKRDADLLNEVNGVTVEFFKQYLI